MICVTFHVLDELSYTFDHIWTNLLTQCTTVPVSFFCWFCISRFPAIKIAPKIPKKLYKKSPMRNLPESPKEGRRGPTRAPCALVARPKGEARQGPSRIPGGPPRWPPSSIYCPGGGNPKYRSSFSHLLSVSPPPPFQDWGCQEKLPRHPAGRKNHAPPGVHPSPWTPPGCAVSSPPWTMGP